ncbi:glycosyltransferase [Arthrobacter sp. H14-L1]|uniref:glycosyltransferase n=1 Tax=Arthrobacter sp. H14-L1 TaxID=2996697 RepID=UPI00226E8A9C|nr:glycosyltransferase [Arthrobacter sp. H14-L1]MCY0905735.1 glycosyl transferase [Arthrobacter sp. H14-L1]
MAKRIVVLQSFPVPRETTNPYITMLWQSLSNMDGLAIKNFSWREALLGRYDIFHVHWPEILVTGRTPVRKLGRQILFILLLLRLSFSRSSVVRTVHNVAAPKDISWVEERLLNFIDAMTAYRIVLNTSTELAPYQRGALVVHGHYREWFGGYEKPVHVDGRLCFFGQIRRYKGVDRLIAAFRQMEAEETELTLHIVGRPSSVDLDQGLRRLAVGDDRISLSLRFQSDAELVLEVSQSELVVLPYAEMHNSGGVLAALSLDRPVLVPDNVVNRKLAQEVGVGWIYMYSGELTGLRIAEVLRQVRKDDRSERPELEARDWSNAGDGHLVAYQEALGFTRSHRRRYS